MTRDLGIPDRSLRGSVVTPAAVVVAFSVGANTVARVVLFVVAGAMLASAATAVCPTYTLIGISTRPRRPHRVGHGICPGHA